MKNRIEDSQLTIEFLGRYKPLEIERPWFGNVFCNPPYGRALRHWVTKAYEESRGGNTHTIVMLLPARTDTTFWHQSIVGKAAIFFLQGRLKFGHAEQVALFPSCLVVWGGSDDLLHKLQAAFPASWLSSR